MFLLHRLLTISLLVINANGRVSNHANTSWTCMTRPEMDSEVLLQHQCKVKDHPFCQRLLFFILSGPGHHQVNRLSILVLRCLPNGPTSKGIPKHWPPPKRISLWFVGYVSHVAQKNKPWTHTLNHQASNFTSGWIRALVCCKKHEVPPTAVTACLIRASSMSIEITAQHKSLYFRTRRNPHHKQRNHGLKYLAGCKHGFLMFLGTAYLRDAFLPRTWGHAEFNDSTVSLTEPLCSLVLFTEPIFRFNPNPKSFSSTCLYRVLLLRACFNMVQDSQKRNDKHLKQSLEPSWISGEHQIPQKWSFLRARLLARLLARWKSCRLIRRIRRGRHIRRHRSRGGGGGIVGVLGHVTSTS